MNEVFDRAVKPREDAKKDSAKVKSTPKEGRRIQRSDKDEAALGTHTKSVAIARYTLARDKQDRIMCAGQAVPIWDMRKGSKCQHIGVEVKINIAALVMNDSDEMVISTGPSNLSYKAAVDDLGSESDSLEQFLGNNVGGVWTWRPDMFPVGGVTERSRLSPGGYSPAMKARVTVGQALPIFERFMPQINKVEFVWLIPDEDGEVEYLDVLMDKKRRFREIVIPLALELKGLPQDYLFRARQALSTKVGCSDVYLAVRSLDGSTSDSRVVEQDFFAGDIPAAVVKITPWNGPESFYAEGLQKNTLAKAMALLITNKIGSVI